MYWNSNLKDGETSRQYIQEYEEAKKQNEQKDEKHTSKCSHTNKRNVLFASSYHSDEIQGSTESSTRKKGMKNLMQSLKISTTAEGRVVEITDQPNPFAVKHNGTKHAAFVQNNHNTKLKPRVNNEHLNRTGKFTFSRAFSRIFSHSVNDILLFSTTNDRIEHSDFKRVEVRPENNMQYQSRKESGRRQRTDQVRSSRSNVNGDRNISTTQGVEPPDRRMNYL